MVSSEFYTHPNYLKLALENSKKVPLDLKLKFCPPPKWDSAIPPPPFRSLAAKFGQCYRICLFTSNLETCDLDSKLVLGGVSQQASLESVECLELSGCGGFRWFLANYRFPSLYKLKMSAEEVRYVKQLVGPHLTHCVLRLGNNPYGFKPPVTYKIDLYKLLGWLAGAPALSNLSMVISLGGVPGPNLQLEDWKPSHRHRFSTLKSLRLEVELSDIHSGKPENRHLLHLCIDTPVLQHLEVGFSDGGPPLSREKVKVGGAIDGQMGYLDSLSAEGAFYPTLRSFSIWYSGELGMVGRQTRDRLLEAVVKMPQLSRLTTWGCSLEFFGKLVG